MRKKWSLWCGVGMISVAILMAAIAYTTDTPKSSTKLIDVPFEDIKALMWQTQATAVIGTTGIIITVMSLIKRRRKMDK